MRQVSLPQIPACRLWTGHAGDARALYDRNDLGIEVLVDLAANESPPRIQRDLTYLRFPLLDGAGNPSWMILAAVECVERLLRENIPTLVACSAGMSRSLMIAAAAVSRITGAPLRSALLEVTSGSGDVSPALLGEVETISRDRVVDSFRLAEKTRLLAVPGPHSDSAELLREDRDR
jgi:hypothetical protein